MLVARIGAVLGMSFSLATGLLFLIGGLLGPSLAAFALFVPALGLMLFAERQAAASIED